MLTTKHWWCILIMKDYSNIYIYLGNIILHKSYVNYNQRKIIGIDLELTSYLNYKGDENFDEVLPATSKFCSFFVTYY